MENWQSVNESVVVQGAGQKGIIVNYQPATQRRRWRIKAVVATFTGGAGQISQNVQFAIVGTVGSLWQNLFAAPQLQAGLTSVFTLGESLARDSETAAGGLFAVGTMPITPQIELGVNDSLQVNIGTVAFVVNGTLTCNVQYEYDTCA